MTVTDMVAFLVKYRILLAFLLVFVAFLYVGNQNRNLSLDNKELTVEIRQSQREGCLRTNRRIDEQSKVLSGLYDAAVIVARRSGSEQSVLALKDQRGAFGGLTKTNCEKAYPVFDSNTKPNQ